tara:strand:- start:2036 stop:2461 length:426 start_codon:yes stop_codon:yes gene_type:complete
MNYIVEPLTIEQMKLLYRVNNIKYGKCNLFYDFIKSLNKLIVETYLGEDYILTNKDIFGHYSWCFKKNIENFKLENIIFKNSIKLKEYFKYYYEEIFYKDMDRSLEKIDNLPELSFNYYRLKSMSDMDIMVELYIVFEKSL